MKIQRDELQNVSVFEGLSDEQLDWIIAHASLLEFSPGDHLFEAGQPADAMFVILKGTLQLVLKSNGQQLLSTTLYDGSVSGVLPYSRMKTIPGDITATTSGRAVRIAKERFPEMLHISPELGHRLVAIMSDRVRETTREQQQREKMMSLGKLSAGLAHELNNPAAAARRDTAELRKRLTQMPTLMIRLVNHSFSSEQINAAYDLLLEIMLHREPPRLSPLERSEREEEFTDLLEAYDVEESWVLVDTLVEVGLRPDELEELSRNFPHEALADIVRWIENVLTTDLFLDRIHSAVSRISDLVSSVKTYSHMDRAPDTQATNIHKGLDNTLVMLTHKLEKNRITLIRKYQEDLPSISAYPGELNQVWTNLIDNASDAMPEGGELQICTGLEGTCVLIRIIDTGTGIPAEFKSRVFEPFFTTKDVSEGTGLGLDIVQRIVTRHHGTVKVASEPGRTEVIVRLPISSPSPKSPPEAEVS